jgi:hypothetical protein
VKCTKGLHEMTEDNTYLDRHGRKHCRGCIRSRKSRYRQGAQRQPLAHHHAETLFNKDRTAMDEALDAQPPVIIWKLDRGGVWRAVEVLDPHTERPQSAQQRQQQLAYYEQRKAAS